MDVKDRLYLPMDPCSAPKLRFNVPHIISFLMEKRDGVFQMSPSDWQREMATTSSERHDKITKLPSNHFLASKYKPFSEVSVRPAFLMFQNWKDSTAMKLSFSIINKSKCGLELYCVAPPSQCFQVQTDALRLKHLSPRQVAVVTVTFTPDGDEDQLYEIKFTAPKKEESFLIPVLAIGPRLLVGCNDCALIEEAYINMISSISFRLSNIHPTQLDLALHIQPPFSVEPSKVILRPHCSTAVTISIKASTPGKHQERLRVVHDSGEIVYIDVIGLVVVGDITLNKHLITILGVFMGTTEKSSVILKSNVHHPVSFSWRRFKREADEQREVEKLNALISGCDRQQEELLKKPDLLSHQNIMGKDWSIIDSNWFLFDNPHFQIYPLNGTISPMSHFECTVLFSPASIYGYKAKAYLHIECIAERTELTLEGTGAGPLIETNVTLFDMGICGYLRKKGLEIAISNNGPIKGTVKYIRDPSLDSIIICEPEKINLDPLESSNIFFCVNFRQKGPFLYELKFVIEESGEFLSVCLKGSVEGMPLEHSPKEIDFGVVGLGFSHYAAFEFTNHGDNSFEYRLVVEGDGTEPPLKIAEFPKHIRKRFPSSPQEFTLVPSNGLIGPGARINVEVGFIPNKVNYAKPMEIAFYISDHKVEDLSIPLKYYSHHPIVTCDPFEFVLKYMAIHEPREIEFELRNDSPAPIAFALSLLGKHMVAQFSTMSGILKAGMHLPVKAVLTPTKLGKWEATVGVDLFGRSTIEETVWIKYTCEPPVLSVNVDNSLDWHISAENIHSDLKKKIVVTNPLLSFSNCFIHMEVDNPHMWSLSPETAEIEYTETITIEPVIVDYGKSIFQLRIFYFENQQLKIELRVFSSVTNAIVTTPNIFQGYDFGHVVKDLLISKPVTFTNTGRREYRLLIKPKDKDIHTNPFAIKPRCFSLKTNDRMEGTLEFQYDQYGHTESVFDFFVVVKSMKIGPIATAIFTANVISKNLAFTCEPNSVELRITDKSIKTAEGTFKLSTDVRYPFLINCTIDHVHFCIIDGDGNETQDIVTTLELDAPVKVVISFRPVCCASRVDRFETKLTIMEKNLGIKKTVAVIGELDYPHFDWSPSNTVDFGCLYPLQDGHQILTLSNNGSIPLDFNCKYLSIYVSEHVNNQTKEIIGDNIPSETEYEETIASEVDRLEKHSEVKQETEPPRKTKKSVKQGKGKKSMKESIKPLPEPEKPATPPPMSECIQRAQKEISDCLVPLVKDFATDPEMLNSPKLHSVLRQPIPLDQFNEYFLVTPFHGVVLPHESVNISLAYHPKEPGKRVVAEVQVYVDEDYQETLTLIGMCNVTFHYEIVPLTVDFGSIPFCEISTREICVKNLSECPFDLEVYNAKQEDGKEEYYQRLATICVSPSVVTVQPFDSVILTAKVHPYVMMKFSKKYELKIHGGQTEILTLQGESSLHFVRLDLPFSIAQVSLMDQYTSLRIVFNRLNVPPEDLPRRPSEVCLSSPEDDFDWEIVSATAVPDLFDLTDSIVMGIAEKAAQDHCEEYYRHATDKPLDGERTLPHVVLPKYVLDLGHTLMDETTTASLVIHNKSDFDSNYYMDIDTSPKKLDSIGLKFDGLDRHHPLGKGETKSHELVFHPLKSRFRLKRKPFIKLKFLLTIKVDCGPIIHVQVRTCVTLPNLSIPEILDFGHVRCNEKIVKKMKIKNENVATCDWSVELKRSFVEKTRRTDLVRGDVPNVFAIEEGSGNHGNLPPHSEIEIFVSFEPRSANEYLGELRTDVDNHRTSYNTLLRGSSICPFIEFNPPEIRFKGVVPYSGFTQEKLAISNKGPIPVELYLPENMDFRMEQFMLRSVLDYMETDVAYVPAYRTDGTLVGTLQEMFTVLINNAQAYFTQIGIDTIGYDFRTLVNEYLDLIKSGEYSIPRDNLQAVLDEKWKVEEKQRELASKSGRLIICTGAPTIDYIHEANQMASAMGLNVSSMDQLFFEEVAYQTSEIAEDIRSAIDNEFYKVMPEGFGAHMSPEIVENINFQPILWYMKVEAINAYSAASPPLAAVSSRNAQPADGSPKSKTAKSKPKTAEQTDRGGTQSPSFEVLPHQIRDLLKPRFQSLMCQKGLVIDRLTSILLNEPALVLALLLSMRTSQDRTDVVIMYTNLAKVMARYDMAEEIEHDRIARLKPRFSQICLFNEDKFAALGENQMQEYFDELKDRYMFCHIFEQVDPGKGSTSSKKGRTKSAQPKKKKASSGKERPKSASRLSAIKKAGGNVPEVSRRELYEMKMSSEFLNYESQQKQILGCLVEGQFRSSSPNSKSSKTKLLSRKRSRTSSRILSQNDPNVWFINSEPNEVQSRIHTLMESLVKWDAFNLSSTRPPETLTPAKFEYDRFFRLDRPPFEIEVFGYEDGVWFPSITHTIGLYGEHEDSPICLYPIEPTAVYCGVSKQHVRRSLFPPDVQNLSHFVLQPGEKITFRATFQPVETGIFGKTLRLNVAGWPSNCPSMEITGIADIPHIDLDLRTLFPPHCYAHEELPVNPSLALVHHTILEMGPTLISKPNDKNNKKNQVTSYLTFKNISHVKCHLQFNIEQKVTPFSLGSEEATLDPGESFKLDVYAIPIRRGFKSCEIVVSIEDNPMPLFIEARVEGIEIDVTVSPGYVALDHVLLGLRKSESLKIFNQTWYPVEWKFSHKQLKEHPYLKFSKTGGLLRSGGAVTVKLSYAPSKLQFAAFALDIWVCPRTEGENSFTRGPTLNIRISSRDVAVDIKAAETNEDRHLIFEGVYVNTPQIQSFIITNLSHFPIRFSLKFNTGLPFKPGNIFQLEPTLGTLSTRKEAVINVTALSKTPQYFKSTPVILAAIYDTMSDVLVAELPILITYDVFCPKYEIHPLVDVCFGNVAASESKSFIFVMKNTGRLPLNYKVYSEKQILEMSELKIISKKKIHRPKKMKSPKGGKKEGGEKKSKKLRYSHPLVIEEPEKLVRIAGGKSSPVKATAKKHQRKRSDAVMDFKSAMKVKTKKPKSAPSRVTKKPSIKSVNAASVMSVGGKNARRLTRRNRSSILRRSLKKMRPVSPPKRGSPFSQSFNTSVSGPFVFENSSGVINPGESKDLKLIFAPLEAGEWSTNYYVKVDNSPQGPEKINVSGKGVLSSISSHLREVLRDALIDLSTETEQHIIEKGYPCNTYHEEDHILNCYNCIVGQKNLFQIYLKNDGIVNSTIHLYYTGRDKNCFGFSRDRDEMLVTIAPLSTKPVQVFFTPKNTEEMEATLHIKLILPRGMEEFHCIAKIRGRGNIPRIAITKPDEYDPIENKYNMNMGASLLGFPMMDFFSIKNVGAVFARVMIEFPRTNGVFNFQAQDAYTESLKHPSSYVIVNPFCLTMTPGQQIEVDVEYTAVSKVLDQCTVFIHVIGNPYEKLELEIFGKGTQKDLIFTLPMRPAGALEKKMQRRKALTRGASEPRRGTTSRPLSEPNILPLKITDPFYYELEFTCMLPKQFVKFAFTVSNPTYFTYRMVLPKPDMIWFVPSEFHIAPTESVEIIALFRAEEQTSYSEMVTGSFEAIAYVIPQRNSWLNAPLLYEKLKNIPESEIKDSDLSEVEGTPPTYEVQAGKSGTVFMFVTARAGMPDLKLLTESVHFPSTHSFEEADAVVFVANDGVLPANCELRLDRLEKSNWGTLGVVTCSMGLLTDEQKSHLPILPELKLSTTISEVKRSGHLYRPSQIKGFETHGMKGCKKISDAGDTTVNARSSELNLDPSMSTISELYNPFSVEPRQLILQPGEIKYVKVAFKPRENCSYACQLVARDILENKNVNCLLDGNTLYSPCHILCEPGKLTDDDVAFALHDDFRVIDVRASTTDTMTFKIFEIMNMTVQPCQFRWERLDKTSNEITVCPMIGCLQRYSTQEVTVNFDPTSTDIVRSSWALSIPDLDVNQHIMFVGRVIVPDVRILPPASIMPSSLVGMFHTLPLEVDNRDNIDHKFALRQLPSTSGYLEVEMEPSKGIIPAKSTVPITLRFTSQRSGNSQMQIACEVKAHNVQSVATIFAEFIELKCKFSMLLENGERMKLEPTVVNQIDLDHIKFRPLQVSFILNNFGQGPFRYKWFFDEKNYNKENTDYLKIVFSAAEGYLSRQSSDTLHVTFHTQPNCEFRNCTIKLMIYRGPTYTLNFSGHADLRYKFNFRKYDFGACPILVSHVCNYITTLNFTNESSQPIMLECKYRNKPHLKVLWTCGEIRTNETVHIMVEFYPSAEVKYQEDVRFIINEDTTENIRFTGEGINIMIRLDDPTKSVVDMRAVQVNTERKKTRRVLNISLSPVTCELSVDPHADLTIEPRIFTMKKKSSQDIVITYSPKSKSQSFHKEVYVRAAGIKQFLFKVKCSSTHVSVSLDRKMLLFGRAVKYCSVHLSANLMNEGEIGVNYQWNLDKLSSMMTVTPDRGYLAPHSILQVNFTLLSLRRMFINQKISVVLNGNQVEELKVLGEFTEIPDPSETISFITHVRSSIDHSINIENKTGEPQIFFPVLIGEYYTSRDFVEVLPHEKSSFTITYSPMRMTSETGHSGRLFIPYPDGTCTYYALIGESLPPEPEDTVEWWITPKTNQTKFFHVHNWTNQYQRLTVNVSLDDIEKLSSSLVSIMGEPTLCLSAKNEVDYPIDAIIFKSMDFVFRIYFFNLETKEYLFYVVKVYSRPHPEEPPRELVGNIGSVNTLTLVVHNPFTEAVLFKLVSPVPELTAQEVLVEPKSEGEMMVEYSPDIVEPEKTVRCKLVAPPFDDEIISFLLKPKPSLPSPPINVDADLGSSESFTVNVKNPSKLTVNYDIETSDELLVQNTEIELGPNQSFELRAVYEPSDIGSKQLVIKLNGSSGDSMMYYVYGTCHPPKPVGPIEVQVGSYETIVFKNVFNEEAKFALQITDPTFDIYIMDSNETAVSHTGLFILASKETAIIVVELKTQDVLDNPRLVGQFPIAGILSIETLHRGSGSYEGPETLLKWEYYVKGVLRPDEIHAVESTE